MSRSVRSYDFHAMIAPGARNTKSFLKEKLLPLGPHHPQVEMRYQIQALCHLGARETRPRRLIAIALRGHSFLRWPVSQALQCQ